MQSSLKSYLSKILFLLLFINSAIYSVDFEGQIALETLKTEGITAIKLALAQYQTNGHAPILINIGSEIIPTQIVETIGKSKREITEEVTQAVSRSLGEMYSLPETDVKKLHKELCSQKEKFTDFEVDTRGVGRARDRFNAIHDSTIGPIKAANRAEAEAKLERKIKNFKNKIKEAHGDKNQERLDEFWSIIIGFIDCNSIDMPRRIDARIHLSKISQCDPDIFGWNIKKAALNLQARYFDKDKLVDVSEDPRLAETMKIFLQDSPYYWKKVGQYADLFSLVEKRNVDSVGSFERMLLRDSGQLSDEERQESYKNDKPLTILGKGMFLPHPDRRKEILNEPYNKALFNVAILCEQKRFEEAEALAKRFGKGPAMGHVLGYYKNLQRMHTFLTGLSRAIIAAREKKEAELITKAALQAEAELKILRELEEEAALKIEAESEQSEQMNQLRSLHRSYITKRVQAFEESKNTDFQRSAGYVNWSAIPSEFRQQFDLDNFETRIEGTQGQLAMQQEFHAITKETARVWKAYGNNAYMQELVKKNVTCIKEGIAQNEKGNIIEAAQFADIAWAVLDHSLAVGEGVVQGTINVAYTFSHPVETAKNIGQLAYIITRSVGQATIEAIDICILGVTNQDAAQKKLKNWEQKFTELTKRAYQHYQEMPSRDITKFISTFATEAFLTGKALRGLKDFLPLARVKTAKIITQAQAITETPALMTTSEGITAGVNQPGHYVEAISSIESSVQLADIGTLKGLGNEGVQIHAGATTLVHANQLAKEEATLKAEADSKQKEKQSLAPTDVQNIEQPISTPAPPSPQQDDPEKDKEKEQSSGSTETYRDSLKNNNLKSNAIKEGLKERFNLTKKIKEHIFSKDHVDKGIFNLGNNEVDIVNKFINIILLADHKDLLKEGANQIHTIINGQKAVIRFFIKEGEILMLNGFIETNAKKIGNVFRLLVEEYL